MRFRSGLIWVLTINVQCLRFLALPDLVVHLTLDNLLVLITAQLRDPELRAVIPRNDDFVHKPPEEKEGKNNLQRKI